MQNKRLLYGISLITIFQPISLCVFYIYIYKCIYTYIYIYIHYVYPTGPYMPSQYDCGKMKNVCLSAF